MSTDEAKLEGYVVVTLLDKFGNVKHEEEISNLITDNGDLYYASKAIAAISPANPAAPTAAARMKLGTGVTAASKSGAGAVLGAYISGSNVAFDATYPATNNLGAGLGVEARYVTTWPAGTATNSAITEATIESSTANSAGVAADVIARVTFTAINKGASDVLQIDWRHKFLGA